MVEDLMNVPDLKLTVKWYCKNISSLKQLN